MSLYRFLAIFYLTLSTTAAHSFFSFIDDFSIELGGGYRIDQFNWNIAGPRGIPNVLSELIWKDLEIWQVNGQVEFLTCQQIYGRLRGDYGWIYSGINYDIDFLGEDRTRRFAYAVNKANQGQVYDLSVGIGYQFTWCEKTLSLAPMVGYSYHSQHLTILEGNLLFNLFAPTNIGPLPDLNSAYKARWYGPWLGVDTTYQVTCAIQLFASYDYHWALYRARAFWNLRPDIPDGFSHHANGYGHVFQAGAQYQFLTHWFAKATALYQVWRTRLGVDITRVINEEGIVEEATQPLNRVNWRSVAGIVTFGYEF